MTSATHTNLMSEKARKKNFAKVVQQQEQDVEHRVIQLIKGVQIYNNKNY